MLLWPDAPVLRPEAEIHATRRPSAVGSVLL